MGQGGPGMPFCSENRRFRDLTHSLTLVAVPDPPPALGVSFVFFIWQMSKYGLKNARKRKVGLKKTCVFLIPLPSLGDLGAEVEERGEVSLSGD